MRDPRCATRHLVRGAAAALAIAAAACSAAWAQAPGGAAAAPPLKGVGARIVTPTTFQNLPQGNFAVLFLFAQPAENRLICERFLIAYKASLANKQPYTKLLYLPINTESTTIDCAKASDVYDQTLWEALASQPGSYLRNLGSSRTAYVALLQRNANGDVTSNGYLILTGQSQSDIDSQFRLFDLYYNQDPRCWDPGGIREKGRIEKWVDAMNVLDNFHCDYK